MDFAAKDTLLGLVRREAAGLIGLASESDTWEAPTACSNWQVRDQVGHMIDATEGYFPGFELARANQESTDMPIGLRAMAARLDERARSHRVLSQSEALDRLQSDLDTATGIYESLSAEDWMGMQVLHPSPTSPARSTTCPPSSTSTRPRSCSRPTGGSAAVPLAATRRWPIASVRCPSRSDGESDVRD
ncbi:MAG TPA: maleylpyruvate isomerase N-terminal domain-containing protein [Sporichthyaceae bacterium]